MRQSVFCAPPTQDVWERIATTTRPIVIYGMGNGADKLLVRLAKIGKVPAAFFASDDFVRGQSFHGFPVLRFSDIQEKYEEPLILLSFATRQPDVIEALFSMAEAHALLMPDMAVAGDVDFDRAFFEEHRSKLLSVYDLLQDKLSKQIFSDCISYKISGDIRFLKHAFSTQEEEAGCLSSRAIHTAIDGGAYIGDTAAALLAQHPEVMRLMAVEPDARNHKRLAAYIEREELLDRVTPVLGALWSEEGVAHFSESGNRNSSLHAASYQFRDREVPLLTVDSLAEHAHIDYIKYDVEGAEAEALLGSRKTILRDHPLLAVSLYHRPQDLFALPLWLHELDPTYHFYLRRPRCLPAWEMTLYAV